MIVSNNVIGTPTDTEYNNLRADLVTNHKHTGNDGSRILHPDLIFPDGYVPIHTHKEIDEHIDANTGVHGIGTIATVASHYTRDGDKFYNIVTGWAKATGSVPYDTFTELWFNFGVTMKDTNYRMFITLTSIHRNATYRAYDRELTRASLLFNQMRYDSTWSTPSWWWMIIGEIDHV